jgi:protein-L-isoaspartate(D-aspartate) O-methyltransferase
MAKTEIEEMRRRLTREIEVAAEETASFTGRRNFSEQVMAAIARVPRHEFLDPGNEKLAYVNRPQPIGCGQTISQPLIVALMTDLLDLKPADRVLEIGTGSGYQAAVLAQVAGQVFSLESVGSLAKSATTRLHEMGYDTITVRHGDGYSGWPEEAPFNAIMVTAAPTSIPQTLCKQLKIGGRIIVPVGPRFSTQLLKLGIKGEDGKVRFRTTLPVAFVPMIKNPATSK